MDGVFIIFDSLDAMSSWMEGIAYEAGERGEAVSFACHFTNGSWKARLV